MLIGCFYPKDVAIRLMLVNYFDLDRFGTRILKCYVGICKFGTIY